MQLQPRQRREARLLGLLVGMEDRASGLQNERDLLGKGVMHLDELTPPVRVIRSTR